MPNHIWIAAKYWPMYADQLDSHLEHCAWCDTINVRLANGGFICESCGVRY